MHCSPQESVLYRKRGTDNEQLTYGKVLAKKMPALGSDFLALTFLRLPYGMDVQSYTRTEAAVRWLGNYPTRKFVPPGFLATQKCPFHFSRFPKWSLD